MRKFLFTLIFILKSQISQSQEKANKHYWHLTIADSLTYRGIPNTTITIDSGKNFKTDNVGSVNLDMKIVNAKTIVTIYCVGYKLFIFQPQQKYLDTIKLARSVTVLKEVTIHADLKKIVLGNFEIPKKHLRDSGFYPGINMEVAEYIPNNEKVTGLIKNLNFALLDGYRGLEGPFKVQIYSRNKNSIYPNTPFIKDSIIVYNHARLQLVSVDVSKYKIFVPEDGFFLSFETLSGKWYSRNSVKAAGDKLTGVPGIRGRFNRGNFKIDTTTRDGIKYALYRDKSRFDDDDWDKFEEGTNFYISAEIVP